MNEPSIIEERQVADMAVDVSTMNSLNPDFGTPAGGGVGRGLRSEWPWPAIR
jgi:hypothetical protein